MLDGQGQTLMLHAYFVSKYTQRQRRALSLNIGQDIVQSNITHVTKAQDLTGTLQA